MSVAPSMEQESLEVQEFRLQLELEKLERAERIKNLQRRIKELERAQFAPELCNRDSTTSYQQAQVSAPVPPTCCLQSAVHEERPAPEVETAHGTTQQAPQSREDVQAPTEIVPLTSIAPSLTLAGEGPPSFLCDSNQSSFGPANISSGVHDNFGSASILVDTSIKAEPNAMATLPLQYYHELEVFSDYKDNNAESLFPDMNLEELYEYAYLLEGNPDNDLGKAVQLSRARYFILSTTNAITDIHNGIDQAEKVVKAIDVNDPKYTSSLQNLIVMLLRKYHCTQALEDLDRAILRAEEMATLTPLSHPDRQSRFADLCIMKCKKGMQTGVTEDLDEAMYWASITTPQEGDSNRAIQHTERTGNVEDIQEAVREAEEALRASPHGHPDRLAKLNTLAVIFSTKFERLNNFEDLQMAIRTAEEAIREAPHGHLSKAIALNTLANSLSIKFERTDDPKDLELAIQRSQEAVEALPHSHQDQFRGVMLSNLAASLGKRSSRTRNLDDLQMTIQKAGEAIEATPRNNPARGHMLNNLFVSLFDRYMRTGDTNDLQLAIQKGEEASNAIPDNHQDKLKLLSNLVAVHDIHFRRTKDPASLQLAAENSERVAKAIPHDHPNRAGILSNLANSQRIKFESTDNFDDLQIAIRRSEEALEAIPHSQTHISTLILGNLAILFQARYEKTNHLDDLQRSIVMAEDAVNTAPQDHPDKAQMLSSLALSLRVRSLRTDQHKDAEQAASHYLSAANMHTAPPRIRIISALHAAEILATDLRWAEVCTVTETAVNLLPKLAPRQLQQRDQQKILEEFGGLAAIAASAALAAGKDASHAVQLLELGRSVIIGLLLGTRSDLTALREQHKEMADKFEKLRVILDPSNQDELNPRTEGSIALATTTNQRHDASLELDRIIDKIRHLPGFENFLRPPQTNELMAAASLGPVVLINVSKYRCDALLVEPTAIRSIHLPDLNLGQIKEMVNLMRSSRHVPSSSSDVGNPIPRILEWLWDTVVHPVLDKLGFLKLPSDGKWPRIWWIPTGPLSLLPLHAASRPFPYSTESALDRVISSYSPSIKALLFARRRPRESINSECREALLVSMGRTPGHSELRFAEEEVNKLSELLPSSIQRVTLKQPRRNDVLASLKNCTIFHFAGHGEPHPSEPLKSRLLLTDWRENSLTVEDLVGLDLSHKSPWLAYLSACSTGETLVENLYDEALNLVSACQLTGFRNVVGSLWEVSDQYSVDVAEEIYKTMKESDGFDDEKIALGVHRAVRLLRDSTNQEEYSREAEVGSKRKRVVVVEEPGRGDKRTLRPYGFKEDEEPKCDPLIWAAYIHVGP